MSDLAIAAAWAGGSGEAAMLEALAQRSNEYGHTSDASCFELPSVDDLEVAAAAAAAAFETIVATDSSDTDTEGSEDSSSSDDEEGVEDVQMTEAGAAATSQQHTVHSLLRLELKVTNSSNMQVDNDSAGAEDAHIQVCITPVVPQHTLPAWEEDNSPLPSSSDDDDDVEMAGKGDSDEEPLDLNDMRELIRKAYDDVDDAGEDDAAAPQNSIGHQLGLPEVQALDVEIAADEALQLAGTVTAVLEGSMVVVQAPENSRPLAEGSVVCLEDRTPVGRIEEIFGPVTTPMYAFRYAGKQPIPAALAAGARLHSVARLANFVSAEEIYGTAKRTARVVVDDDEPSDEEVYFSDDEKEAEHQRKLKAKRKHADEAPQPGRGRGGSARGGRGGRWSAPQEQSGRSAPQGPSHRNGRGRGAPQQPNAWHGPPQGGPEPPHAHSHHAGGRGQADRQRAPRPSPGGPGRFPSSPSQATNRQTGFPQGQGHSGASGFSIGNQLQSSAGQGHPGMGDFGMGNQLQNGGMQDMQHGGNYGAPQQGGGNYGAPQQQHGVGNYGKPQQQHGGGQYGASQQQHGGGNYGAPQQQHNYGAPQQQHGGGMQQQDWARPSPPPSYPSQPYGPPPTHQGHSQQGQPAFQGPSGMPGEQRPFHGGPGMDGGQYGFQKAPGTMGGGPPPFPAPHTMGPPFQQPPGSFQQPFQGQPPPMSGYGDISSTQFSGSFGGQQQAFGMAPSTATGMNGQQQPGFQFGCGPQQGFVFGGPPPPQPPQPPMSGYGEVRGAAADFFMNRGRDPPPRH